jgi:uncharacterized protein (TIGR03437 family)
LYGTGFRYVSSLGAVQATAGGVPLEVVYAGPQPQYPGLDQIDVKLPASLSGSRVVDLTITIDGAAANTVQIDIL